MDYNKGMAEIAAKRWRRRMKSSSINGSRRRNFAFIVPSANRSVLAIFPASDDAAKKTEQDINTSGGCMR